MSTTGTSISTTSSTSSTLSTSSTSSTKIANKENICERVLCKEQNTAGKQKKGLKRNTIDKYYTKPSVVIECVELIKTHVNIDSNDLIIEPSAGNGSFVDQIKLLGTNYQFYDLEPENTDVIKQDFLELDCGEFKKNYPNIHVIGNPPFGRQSSLAIKFIKKCCTFSKSISFILPKSFKKDSMKKAFDANYHLVHEIDLSENSFLVNGIDTDVPCIFQIWKHQDVKRVVNEVLEPEKFTFVSKDCGPDISFRRVGVYAKTISTEIENKSPQSHYFIKFSNGKTIEENIEKIKEIHFDFNNTVGPKSISKQELIREFNKVLT